MPPPFFNGDTLPFLADLKANYTKDWFDANRGRYEAAGKAPAAAFAEDMAVRLGAWAGTSVTKKIFRINRDIRFSKDKTPYNAHIHILWSTSKDDDSPGWYFGVAPDYLTLGAGVMQFSKAGLESFRERIDGPEGDSLAQLLENLMGQGGRLNDPPLKRVPAPYAKDHRHGALLRRKGLAIWFDEDDPGQISQPGLTEQAMARFETLRPLFAFFD